MPLLGLYRRLIANTIIIKKEGRLSSGGCKQPPQERRFSLISAATTREPGSTRRIIRRNWVEIAAEECYTSNNNIQSVNFLSFLFYLGALWQIRLGSVMYPLMVHCQLNQKIIRERVGLFDDWDISHHKLIMSFLKTPRPFFIYGLHLAQILHLENAKQSFFSFSFLPIPAQWSAADYRIRTPPPQRVKIRQRSLHKCQQGSCKQLWKVFLIPSSYYYSVTKEKILRAGVTTRNEKLTKARLHLIRKKWKKKKKLLWSMNRWRRRIFQLLLTISSIFISYADDSQFFFRLSSFSLSLSLASSLHQRRASSLDK